MAGGRQRRYCKLIPKAIVANEVSTNRTERAVRAMVFMVWVLS
jgi:hypothetical protein